MYRFNTKSDNSNGYQDFRHSIALDDESNIWKVTSPSFKSRSAHLTKRVIDILGSLALIVALSPFYFLIYCAVILSMGRPVHFWQNRCGKDGNFFHFYKFRSMVNNSESILEEHLSKNDFARTEWELFQKLAEDPRITPVGRFIRRFSIDELPQIFNVLKGDMSLVGPRPCMENQRHRYGKHWGTYCAMRPGITGLWQVSGRNRLPYSKRVELDAFYVSNWSLWLDVKIIFRTFRAVIAGEGCR
ncbi:lipopolysaccharide/colanic/teichoic acid biosynthesis glycosyltransferase [Variovorax boronicumulans]|uniref:sugar transferase n=1 Tax=Variovorax boronicumulans TaxID=436515 RepID=UPI00277D6715|nr:sugar transferase [Variovorax boronicumulans]MDP9912358.1 lipopolysaccharide/colanic/teichoic acid biosynthesis glycosyltransferase [Variovorax boronicumulans]